MKPTALLSILIIILLPTSSMCQTAVACHESECTNSAAAAAAAAIGSHIHHHQHRHQLHLTGICPSSATFGDGSTRFTVSQAAVSAPSTTPVAATEANTPWSVYICLAFLSVLLGGPRFLNGFGLPPHVVFRKLLTYWLGEETVNIVLGPEAAAHGVPANPVQHRSQASQPVHDANSRRHPVIYQFPAINYHFRGSSIPFPDVIQASLAAVSQPLPVMNHHSLALNPRFPAATPVPLLDGATSLHRPPPAPAPAPAPTPAASHGSPLLIPASATVEPPLAWCLSTRINRFHRMTFRVERVRLLGLEIEVVQVEVVQVEVAGVRSLVVLS